MLGCSIEEGVNEAVKRSWDEGNSFGLVSGEQNFKAQYQRYIFDFFKEGKDGGYTDKIDLPDIGKSDSTKKKLQLNYFAIAFGATIHMEYEVMEEDGLTKLGVSLESGDAFVTNSSVKSICYRVKETSNKYSQNLVMRDGCLLISAERD